MRTRLRDADLSSHLGRAPMRPLDREKIKYLAGPANATHSPTVPSPVTGHLRINTVTEAAFTPAVSGRNSCDPKRMSRAVRLYRTVLGRRHRRHASSSNRSSPRSETGWEAAVDMMLCVRPGEFRRPPTSDPGDLMSRLALATVVAVVSVLALVPVLPRCGSRSCGRRPGAVCLMPQGNRTSSARCTCRDRPCGTPFGPRRRTGVRAHSTASPRNAGTAR